MIGRIISTIARHRIVAAFGAIAIPISLIFGEAIVKEVAQKAAPAILRFFVEVFGGGGNALIAAKGDLGRALDAALAAWNGGIGQ